MSSGRSAGEPCQRSQQLLERVMEVGAGLLPVLGEVQLLMGSVWARTVRAAPPPLPPPPARPADSAEGTPGPRPAAVRPSRHALLSAEDTR